MFLKKNPLKADIFCITGLFDIFPKNYMIFI